MNKIFFLAIGVFTIVSCIEKDPIGKWDDNIHLSTRDVVLGPATDSATITTQGTWWWLNSLSLHDSLYFCSGLNSVDTGSEHWKITNSEFSVERRNFTTLFIKMQGNTTGVDDTLYISLQAGDYFDYVRVKRKGK